MKLSQTAVALYNPQKSYGIVATSSQNYLLSVLRWLEKIVRKINIIKICTNGTVFSCFLSINCKNEWYVNCMITIFWLILMIVRKYFWNCEKTKRKFSFVWFGFRKRRLSQCSNAPFSRLLIRPKNEHHFVNQSEIRSYSGFFISVQRYKVGNPDEYSEPHQTSKIQLFVKINKQLEVVKYFANSSILDVWQSSEYTSEIPYLFVKSFFSRQTLVKSSSPEKAESNIFPLCRASENVTKTFITFSFLKT